MLLGESGRFCVAYEEMYSWKKPGEKCVPDNIGATPKKRFFQLVSGFPWIRGSTWLAVLRGWEAGETPMGRDVAYLG